MDTAAIPRRLRRLVAHGKERDRQMAVYSALKAFTEDDQELGSLLAAFDDGPQAVARLRSSLGGRADDLARAVRALQQLSRLEVRLAALRVAIVAVLAKVQLRAERCYPLRRAKPPPQTQPPTVMKTGPPGAKPGAARAAA